MANKVLKVKDPKTGEIRPMTEKSYQLAGEKRGFKIVGEVEQPKSEMDILKEQKRAELLAKREQAENQPEQVTEQVETKRKPGPKPKPSAE